jgi:hypothetical protein
VKIDVNIEADLASALKVTESDCPQILFLWGNRILYREKGKVAIPVINFMFRPVKHVYL